MIKNHFLSLKAEKTALMAAKKSLILKSRFMSDRLCRPTQLDNSQLFLATSLTRELRQSCFDVHILYVNQLYKMSRLIYLLLLFLVLMCIPLSEPLSLPIPQLHFTQHHFKIPFLAKLKSLLRGPHFLQRRRALCAIHYLVPVPCGLVSAVLQSAIVKLSVSGPVACGVNQRCNFALQQANSTYVKASWHSVQKTWLSRKLSYAIELKLESEDADSGEQSLGNNQQQSQQQDVIMPLPSQQVQQQQPQQDVQFISSVPAALANSLFGPERSQNSLSDEVRFDSAEVNDALHSLYHEFDSDNPHLPQYEHNDLLPETPDSLAYFDSLDSLDSLDSELTSDPSDLAGINGLPVSSSSLEGSCTIHATARSLNKFLAYDSGVGYCRLRHLLQETGFNMKEVGSEETCDGYDNGVEMCEKRSSYRNWWA